MLESIRGLTETKIFYNEQNHYGIFLIALEDAHNETMTIVGNLYNIELYQSYEFHGHYVDDPRYGLQFKVERFSKILPSEKEHVILYLSGPSFPGIGIKSAQSIVEKYGDDIIDQIQKDPDMALSVRGISKKNIEIMREVILNENPMDKVVSFLNSVGFSGNDITAILAVYQEEAEAIIRENPYRLVEEVSGIGFKTADKVGKHLGFEEEHPYYLEAYVSHIYKTKAWENGHSYIEVDSFLESFDTLNQDLLVDAYQSLLQQGILVDDAGKLYHHTQYDAEVLIANFLNSFNQQAFDMSSEEFESHLKVVEYKLKLQFGDSQIEAIQLFLKENIAILTGGPGTGKSTLLAGIVSYLQLSYPNYRISLCAPTGRASKRLTELTHLSATTIHSLIKWNLETNEFGHNAQNPLDTDILIIDEFSMVDTWLFSKLLDASSNVKKILIVGDQDQLPSVGPGFVLKDLIDSKAFPIMTLDRNYRQEEGSEVVDLALMMNEGHFNIEGFHKNIQFYDAKKYDIRDIMVQLVQAALNKGYSLFDIQVLAPVYRGKEGIDNLNYTLQSAFNPADKHKKETKFGSKIFREGDKILQLKNQPDDGVFNGDIGRLVDVGFDNSVTVDFDGVYVTYDRADMTHISHAYCLSVHKAQGSEYPIVLLFAMHPYHRMLSRRLYYTAVTRSSRALILLGHLSAFEKAVKNGYEDRRFTYLKERLVVNVT